MKKILLILAATIIAAASLFGLVNLTANKSKMKAEITGDYDSTEFRLGYTLNDSKKFLTEIEYTVEYPEDGEEEKRMFTTDKSKDFFFKVFDTEEEQIAGWLAFKKDRDYKGFDKITIIAKKESGQEIANNSFDISNNNLVKFFHHFDKNNRLFHVIAIEEKTKINIQKNGLDEKVLFQVFFSKSDANAPIITGQKVWLTNVDDPISIEEIKSHLQVNDEIDGIIDSSKITIKEDNYTANKKRVGNYNITFAVKDAAQNEAEYVVTVNVKDLVKPTIKSKKDTYKIGYKEDLDSTIVKNNLTATDNYDTGNLEVNLINNTYEANKSNLGTYTLEFEAVDTSGNKATKKISIEVIDNVKPILTYQQIRTSYKNKITLADVLEQVTITDEKDTEITKAAVSLVSETYSSKFDKVGNYQFILKGKDKYNNETQIAVPVEVYDDVAPVITTDEYFIALDQFQLMTIQEIIDFMKSKNLLDSNFELSNHTIIEDTYTSSNFIPGMHFVKMQNNETGKEIIINVDTKKADTTDINENTNQNTTSDLIKNQWNNVKDFLVKNWVYVVSGLGGLILLAIIIRIAVGGRRRRW